MPLRSLQSKVVTEEDKIRRGDRVIPISSDKNNQIDIIPQG